MRFNFKKIAAIGASVLMVGMSMGVAAAANFPAPFSGTSASTIGVVVGSGTGVDDGSATTGAVGTIASYLAGKVTGDTTSATGGDNINLATSARKLYYGDGINSGRPSLTYTELADVLKDGTFTDLSGTQYDYTQVIKVGTAVSAFGTSGGDIDDPALLLQVGTTAATLYNYTLSFTKNVNVSDATNVQGQKINILGVDYVIGSGSTNSTLYLYGSGETITISGGDSVTVNIAGADHTVELITTSGSSAGTIKVDGVQKSVTQGNNYAFAGEISVYVKDIIHPAFAGDMRQAELIVGANTLKLVSGQTVKEGADQTSIKGTLATITAAGVGKISGFTVGIAMPKSSNDHIGLGESFTDPVFGGLKVEFANAVPPLSSTARGKIVVNTDNNQFAYATFTSARAGTAGEQKLTYAYDNDTASSTIQPVLAMDPTNSDAKGFIHVLEGENAKESDFIILNQGDSGTILEVDDISIDTTTSGTVTFTDVITGNSQKITLTNSSNVYSNSNVNFFGGTGYTVKVPGSGATVNVTWSSAGTSTLFPSIKLANGGWLAFMENTTITNGTSVIFPDGLTTLAATGTEVVNTTVSYTVNGITWLGEDDGVNLKITGIESGATTCSFTTGPALLFIEPKKWNDGSYGNFICIPLTTTGTTEIAIADPVINGTNSGFTTLNSDTYKKQAVDKFGALISKEDRTNENGVVTVSYPESQMYLDVLFTAEGVSVTTGGISAGTIVFNDQETAWKSRNVVLVGGSCINEATALALGVPYPTCETAFTSATNVGDGQYLIKSIAGSSGGVVDSGKIALVVAGYNKADTAAAVSMLISETEEIDTAAGSEYFGIITAAGGSTLTEV